jgi:hypothetical protein
MILLDAAWQARAQTTAEAPAENANPASTFEQLAGWLGESYRHEPALMAVVAAILVLSPLVAMLALVYGFASRTVERRRTSSVAPLRKAMEAAAFTQVDTPATSRVRHAVLELLDDTATRMPIDGSMIRIGRHEENDIRLANKTVHRYHAVVHVTADQRFVITDLSGKDGNGVLLNSERVEQAPLAAGDIIELGDVKMRFTLPEA